MEMSEDAVWLNLGVPNPNMFINAQLFSTFHFDAAGNPQPLVLSLVGPETKERPASNGLVVVVTPRRLGGGLSGINRAQCLIEAPRETKRKP